MSGNDPIDYYVCLRNFDIGSENFSSRETKILLSSNFYLLDTSVLQVGGYCNNLVPHEVFR